MHRIRSIIERATGLNHFISSNAYIMFFFRNTSHLSKILGIPLKLTNYSTQRILMKNIKIFLNIMCFDSKLNKQVLHDSYFN